MSGDQVAAMSPLIQKVFESPGDGWCATFEIIGVRDAWAQVMKGKLNIAYPCSRHSFHQVATQSIAV
jgi:hypothetical protein